MTLVDVFKYIVHGFYCAHSLAVDVRFVAQEGAPILQQPPRMTLQAVKQTSSSSAPLSLRLTQHAPTVSDFTSARVSSTLFLALVATASCQGKTNGHPSCAGITSAPTATVRAALPFCATR